MSSEEIITGFNTGFIMVGFLAILMGIIAIVAPPRISK